MNANNKPLNRIPTEFERETRLESSPATSAAFRAALETEFERLKTRLLTRALGEATTPELDSPLHRAANEAAALAWETIFPLLVFPVLFEEKAAVAQCQSKRQARIWAGRELAAA